MLRVALTGGAASGKSAVAAMLRHMGAHVSQSDEVGRALMQPGTPVYAAIAALFGPGVVRADGTLDRPALARLAFEEGRLNELNAIVHPAVIAAQAEWMQAVAGNDPLAVAVVESALVLQTPFGSQQGMPWHTRFDHVVVVCAPQNDRLERYTSRVVQSDQNADRDAIRADALRRFAAQLPESRMRELADTVLENDGTLDGLEAQAEALFQALRTESERRSRASAIHGTIVDDEASERTAGDGTG